MLKTIVMAKWDNAPFTKKELKQLKEHPPKVDEDTTVTCPCGRFTKGKVKDLKHDGDSQFELRCPACGNFNLRVGLLFLRIFEDGTPTG